MYKEQRNLSIYHNITNNIAGGELFSITIYKERKAFFAYELALSESIEWQKFTEYRNMIPEFLKENNRRCI